MRVTIIVNRRARHLQHRGPLLDILQEPREGVRIVETSSLAELDHAAQELAREPPDVVVLAGGDGSYMAGVTAIARALGEKALSELPIALAPGGTSSTVPRDWDGRRGDATRRMRAVFAALADVRTTMRPTLRVRDTEASAQRTRQPEGPMREASAQRTRQPEGPKEEASAQQRIGFIFGAGLVARFFELYERAGAGGEKGAAKIVARIFAGSFVGGRTAKYVLTPQPCTIEVDGARAPFDRASLVCASVVRDLGLHMHLLYRAAERHDRFHVVATPVRPRVLGPQMPRVLAGRPLRDPKVDTLAATLSLRFPEGAGAYVLDGELLRSDAVEVSAGPLLRVVDVG